MLLPVEQQPGLLAPQPMAPPSGLTGFLSSPFAFMLGSAISGASQRGSNYKPFSQGMSDGLREIQAMRPDPMQQLQMQAMQQKMAQDQAAAQQKAQAAEEFNQYLKGGSPSDGSEPNANANLTTKDPARLAAAHILFLSGSPDKALEMLTPKPGDAYTLSPGQVRYDANNKPVVSVPGRPKGNGTSSIMVDPKTGKIISTGMPSGGMTSAGTAALGVNPMSSDGTDVNGEANPSAVGVPGFLTPEGNVLIKNSAMGPARGGQGGTYKDPVTGAVFSSDTNSQTSNDQLSAAAVNRVLPQVDDIIKDLPQFQTLAGHGKALLQGVANKTFGTNYELPSILAEGQKKINQASEGMIKALGLPQTNESIDLVRDIFRPGMLESGEAYKARLEKIKSDLISNQSQSKARLQFGIPLNPQATAQQQASMQTQGSAPPMQAPAAIHPIQQQSQQLQALAQDAVKRGANPGAVQARLAQQLKSLGV